MNNKVILASIAMDLKRVALGYHRMSLRTANRFLEEALKRRREIDDTTVKPSILKILNRIENLGLEKEKDKAAEDALLYSILLQNAALSQKSVSLSGDR